MTEYNYAAGSDSFSTQTSLFFIYVSVYSESSPEYHYFVVFVEDQQLFSMCSVIFRPKNIFDDIKMTESMGFSKQYSGHYKNNFQMQTKNV